MWKSRYQGANFCQTFLGNASRSWQKFASWYLLFHHEKSLNHSLWFSRKKKHFSVIMRPVALLFLLSVDFASADFCYVQEQHDHNPSEFKWRQVSFTNNCNPADIHTIRLDNRAAKFDEWDGGFGVYSGNTFLPFQGSAYVGQTLRYPIALYPETEVLPITVQSVYACTAKLGCRFFEHDGTKYTFKRNTGYCCTFTSATSRGCKFWPWITFASCSYTIIPQCTAYPFDDSFPCTEVDGPQCYCGKRLLAAAC